MLMKIKAAGEMRSGANARIAGALCSSYHPAMPLGTPISLELLMKYFLPALIAALLSACVSAPSDLYGIHVVKPAPDTAHAASAVSSDAKR
jgi:hypothetical protein